MAKLKFHGDGPAHVGPEGHDHEGRPIGFDADFEKGQVREIPDTLAAEIRSHAARWRARGFELIEK